MLGEEPTMACDHNKKINGFEKYEIESAAEALMRAIKIRKDPKLFPLAQKAAAKIAKEAADVALEKKVAAKLVQTFRKNG